MECGRLADSSKFAIDNAAHHHVCDPHKRLVGQAGNLCCPIHEVLEFRICPDGEEDFGGEHHIIPFSYTTHNVAPRLLFLGSFLDGGIRTTLGTCLYYEMFEHEWLSYFFIWAATKRKLLLLRGKRSIILKGSKSGPT
jgi:hypothetical protein